jgi:hypothetical protein
MFPNDKVPLSEQAGCWGACHKDARKGMPGAEDKKTKYVTPGAMDLMQWKSSGGKSVDGT